MSLIDEALRRAREEAARQDAAQREARFRQPAWVPAPRRSSRNGARIGLIGAVLAGCVAAGLGFGILLGRNDGEPKVAETAATPRVTPGPPPAPAVPEAPATPEEIARETPVPARPEPVLQPQPEPEPPAAAPEPEPIAEAPAPAAPPVQIAPAPTAPPAAEPAPPEEPAAEAQSYVREVPVPGGASLSLKGIAFSAAQPVALINDRVLARGEVIEGFTVAAIEPGRVELRGHGRTVYVTLK